jgi:uncharacterized protein YidB (DUF937 family)
MNNSEEIIEHLVGDTGATNGARAVEDILGAMFQSSPAGLNSTGINGMPGLIKRFEDIGLGKIIHSWTGQGPKLPITPDEVRAVIGDTALKALTHNDAAAQASLLIELTQLLPGVVERLNHSSK